MEERHISQLIQNLEDRFNYLGVDSFNLTLELNSLIHPVTRIPIEPDVLKVIEHGFLARINYKRSYEGAILTPVSIVTDPKGHEEWYDSWLAENNNSTGCYYWKRLENFLSHELAAKHGAETAGRIVRSLDDATFKIMEKVSNPLRKQFSYKGLVVGYVQSGKTANFTALIAKAADAGYKLIIVLAGIHNILRRQTQIRLDRELTGLRDVEGPDNYIPLPGAAKAWSRLTTAHNDFSLANLGLFATYCPSETPILAVVKKNVSVLTRLIEYISAAPEASRANLPVLFIDDEADQASINTKANDPDPETDPSRINDCIRTLLNQFARKTYIGYTATPFANILIDMATDHEILEDDLYPRNFIVSLPEPEGYFGTSLVFRGDLSERFVRVVPDDANTIIRHGHMTPDLSQAIDEFVLCCAVRNLRDDRMKPMSMLIHISPKVNDMSTVKNIISNDDNSGYIQNLSGRYRSTEHSKVLKAEFKKTWESFSVDAEAINRVHSHRNVLPSFEEIWREMKNVFTVLRVVELNYSSEDRLDYTTGEEIKVIAIGGNQLSRGLTLEGLMTSYYLRAAGQYDTLLQMGRWFGYRRNYEDLTRIHTTEQIAGYFEHLALVEAELRSDIYRYEEERKTPLEMAVAIRAHSRLKVTAKNKMGAARSRQISFSDALVQTTWFPLDQAELLRGNYNLGDSFIKRFKNIGFKNINGVHLAKRKIDGETILRDFLNRYNFAEKDSTGGPGLDAENLLAYIFRRLNDSHAELTQWSLAVVGNTGPSTSKEPISYGNLPINRIQRSRKFTLKGYNIGVLTEPDHLNIDLESNEKRSPENPLLLLYLINKDSKAKGGEIPESELRVDQRIDLYRFLDTEKIDVLGLAIVLPESRFEPNNYLGQ